MSYSNVDETLEGYKIKSALPFKILSSLNNSSDDFSQFEQIGKNKYSLKKFVHSEFEIVENYLMNLTVQMVSETKNHDLKP